MADDEAIKFSIQLPPWFERRLRLWAKVKGTTRATLAANIIQSRIEANREQIDADMAAIAAYLGTTVEALEKDWLNGGED